ncbi:hypothetical protein BU24DRAFT_442223 [Aaosphaeria arxii CBS 175.79]|uniref:DUF829-domain-containing protein n=1 Tax=Aaosphaeria arxii CBS 175.79 TaxID=1450172 RepID=A0A6A5XQT4_9PLEO|nr:uncharacterized protein BU24DRAFT_442223 [Aaosphaeria arxii CBS 175.79]KAF2015121.1 hypothetical protein BU24DRAFT_442223 [Aaosphaeria arxii CBS 175.79]
METLSPSVYMLHPSPDNTTPTPKGNNPTLIIIVFGWMKASKNTLAKYVRHHQALFPVSTILLVTCTFAGMTIPRLGLREARIAAIAARAVLEPDEAQTTPHSDAESRPSPRLLVHVFSNAGSTMLYHLYMAYATTSSSDAPKNTVLPLHATIFDSTPAPFTYQTLLKGILDGTPSAVIRLAVMPVAYLYVALVWTAITLLRVPDHIGDLAPRAHNDPARVHETCRVYVYGPADRITPAAAVKHHAHEAEAKGFSVQHEVFDGTGHVAHARKHADRYWRVVGQTWEESRL